MKNIFIIFLLLCGSIFSQSLNKKYNVTQRFIGDAKEVGEYNFVEYSVKSNSGKELYQIVDKVDYDIPYSKLEIFNDGSSVLISSFYGTLTFISNNGTKTKTIKIKNDIEVEYERSIKSISDENNLVVLFNELNGNYSTIQKYNTTGNILNEFTIDITDVNGIAYSKKLKQVFVSMVTWKDSGSLEKKVVTINNGGEIEKAFKTNFEKGFFTEDNKFIGISNKSVFSINTVNLKMDYEIKAEENSIFIDVTENSNSLIVAQAKNPELKEGEWYYKNPTIIRLDSSGTVVMRNNLKTELFKNYKFQKVNTGVEFITDSF
ncbi:MAG: hypothetical protein L3J41_10775 [Melioribacteraceae bacterium]|nr:hypothetical protein [Melioribacteraceae bacterium]